MIAECPPDRRGRTAYTRLMANPRGTGRSDAGAPALLPDGAFVVEFGSGSGRRLSGRVEHVTSGDAVRFDSEAQLLEFVRKVMRAQTPPEGGREET